MSAFMTFGTASPRSPVQRRQHRQARATERYAHLKYDPLRAVANRTSERIAAIMQGQQGHQKSFHCRRQKRPVKVTKPEDARARAYV